MTAAIRRFLAAALVALLTLTTTAANAADYVYRSTGTIASNNNSAELAPGAPTGKAVGDRLLLFTGNRALSVAIASLATDWTQIYVNNSTGGAHSFELWVRIADGTAADTPAVDWTGTNDSFAWISAYSGGGYDDLSTIVADTPAVTTGSDLSALRLPTLDVITDNTLLIAVAIKNKTATSNDATTLSISAGGLTKRAQLIMAGTAVFAIEASVQQTTATDYDGTDVTRNGTDETKTSMGIVLSLKTSSAVAPTFDTSPTKQSQTATAFTLAYDADANATNIYCAAYPIGTAEQTGAAIEAGTGAHGTATEATTGASDTLVLTPTDSPVFPAYEPQCVLKGAGGYSTVTSLPNEFLDPTSGFQFVIVDGLPWGAGEESILDGASPAIVDGDIIRVSSHVNSFALGPAAHVLTMAADGVPEVNPGQDTSRLDFVAHVYDVSLEAYSDAAPVAFFIENVPPQYIGNLDDVLILIKDEAMTAYPLEPGWTDEEGDAMTVTFQDALPTGVSNTAEELVGTPTGYSVATAYTQRNTDITGDFTDAEFLIAVGDYVAEVADTAEAAAIAAIEAVASMTAVAGTAVYSDTIVEGNVISTDPIGGTRAEPDAEITYVTSLGVAPATQRRKLSLGLDLGISDLIEVLNAANDEFWELPLAA